MYGNAGFHRRRASVTTLLAGTLVVALAACSSSSTTSSSSSSSSTGAAVSAGAGASLTGSTGSATPTGSAGTSSGAGTSSSMSSAAPVKTIDSVKIATEQDVAGLDVISAPVSDLEMYAMVYDTLIGFDNSGKLVPDLATAWKANADASTWTFTLRSTARFNDGTPVTADDVVFTYDSIMKLATSGEAYAAGGVKSVAKTGPNTVVFTMKAPQLNFPNLTQEIGIVSQKAYTAMGAKAYGNKPVGSGPYQVVSTNNVDTVVLKVNPYYWGTKPAAQNVTVQHVTSQTTRLNGLQSGQFDLAQLSGTNVTVATRSGLKVDSIPSTKVIYLGYNTNAPYLSNVKFRQAISYAVDRGALVKSLLAGLGQPVDQSMAPAVSGFDKSIVPPTQDIAKAKQLLAESGYAGQAITFDWSQDYVPAASEVAQAVLGYLKAVGINANLRSSTEDSFLTQWSGKKLPGIYLFSNQSNSLDGGSVLSYATQVVNTFKDPTIDALITKENGQLDPAARAITLGQISQRINDQAYYTNLFVDTFNFVHSSKINYAAPAVGYLLPQNITSP